MHLIYIVFYTLHHKAAHFKYFNELGYITNIYTYI